jgi:hypothetical protein
MVPTSVLAPVTDRYRYILIQISSFLTNLLWPVYFRSRHSCFHFCPTKKFESENGREVFLTVSVFHPYPSHLREIMIPSYKAFLLEIQTKGNWEEFWFKCVSELTNIFKVSLGTNKCFLSLHIRVRVHVTKKLTKLTKQIHELHPLIFPCQASLAIVSRILYNYIRKTHKLNFFDM